MTVCGDKPATQSDCYSQRPRHHGFRAPAIGGTLEYVCTDDPTPDSVAAQLAELRARYQAMVEEAPEAIVVIDVNKGRFVEVNRRACDVFRMPREALLQTGLVAMSPTVQPNGVPSGIAVKLHLDRALRGDTPRFEWTHTTGDGDPVLCRIHLARVSTPTSGAALVRASVVDITEQRATERMRDRLSAIIDATTDIVGVADTSGRALFINSAGRRLLGLTEDEDIRGRSICEFHPPEVGRNVEKEGIPHALREGQWRAKTTFRSRTGELIPTSQVIIAHRDERGRIEFLSTVARDMRDHLAAEELERRVLHAQKLESLGVLAGGIAHDFNNILVGVLTNASLLASKLPVSSPAHSTVVEIEAAGRRASELAQQMLAYAGRARVVAEDVNLSEMLTEISELVSASVSKRARLELSFADSLPTVRGDPTQIRQVLMNLVINASEALDNGDGVITVTTRTERVDPDALLHCHLSAGSLAQECVVAEVRDNGSGIGEDALERIFDPFFTTKFTGRGLGLSSVLGIMRVHEGGIGLTTSSAGTTFTLVFGAAPSNGTEEKPIPSSKDPREPGRNGAGTLLVADDESTVRRVVRAIAEEMGFAVEEVDNGTDALHQATCSGNKVSVIILDLTMPGLTGLEVLEQVRKSRPRIPVVLTSGYPRNDLAKLGSHVTFVGKPFSLDDLESAIERAIRGD